jgi:crotonobetainyl-CoA:carnitine CoA-transferase CaiB-like acyl-CoA transferase
MAVPLLHHDYGGAAPERVGIAHPSIVPYGAFTSADGLPIVISIQNEREWLAFGTEVLDDPDLASDPRFAGNAVRVARRSEVERRVAEAFAALPAAALIARLEAASIAFAVIQDVSGLSRHPHLRRIVAGSPEGPVSLPAPPVRWADRPLPGGAVPALGAHDAAIRLEFADRTSEHE